MEVRLLHRGELSKPGEIIEPGFPRDLDVHTLMGPETGAQGLKPTPVGSDLASLPPKRRRSALAQWLTAPENPLTARVLVNRIWGWHFGNGLARTPSDFGNHGEPPTHPDLLDWLAHDFIEHGWSLKHLHRRILLSNTYQMGSVATADTSQTDAENRLLSHFPRRRLEAETIWDALHSCAGTLNLKPFGPPVVPSLTKDEITGLFQPEQKWQVTKDPAEHTRRGVYLFVRRTFLLPLFDTFDPPEVMTSCARRRETIVPAQALALLNSQVVAEQSRAFAARLLKECGEKPKAILRRAWLLAFNRPISPTEGERAESFLRKRGSDLGVDESGEAALAQLCLALINANEFIYMD